MYLQDFQNLNPADLDYLFDILRDSNVGWNLNFVIEIHENVNYFIISTIAKGLWHHATQSASFIQNFG